MTRALNTWLKGALGGALDWFYPPHCYHCGRALAGGPDRVLCAPCRRVLEGMRIRPPVCALCGLPLGAEPDCEGARCIRCQVSVPHFDRARALFGYAGPAASLVRSFKFHGSFYLGGRLLRRAWEAGWVPQEVLAADAVAHVPLHPRRARERGYDQALMLARAVGRLCGKPVVARALRRARYTDQQALLTPPRRLENVRGAFRAGGDRVEGLDLLLVDDVMTTGATASECARVLKAAGARAVQVLTLVRTIP